MSPSRLQLTQRNDIRLVPRYEYLLHGAHHTHLDLIEAQEARRSHLGLQIHQRLSQVLIHEPLTRVIINVRLVVHWAFLSDVIRGLAFLLMLDERLDALTDMLCLVR